MARMLIFHSQVGIPSKVSMKDNYATRRDSRGVVSDVLGKNGSSVLSISFKVSSLGKIKHKQTWKTKTSSKQDSTFLLGYY